MSLPILVAGDANEYVTLLQRFLVLNTDLKRDESRREPVTGKYDAATTEAVKHYKARPTSRITTETGVGGQTWASIAGVPGPLPVIPSAQLKSTKMPTLSAGKKDALIFLLQRLLFEYSDQATLAYLPRGIITKDNLTGVFDETTVRAVKAFQTNRGIAADGIVGPKTWEKLFFPSLVTA